MAAARRMPVALACAALAAALTAAPVRADPCEDLAGLLKSQIDGLAVGKPAANHIALAHPAVTKASLGCAARNVTNEVFLATDSRKPSDAFYDFAARAAAVVFTIPSDDIRRGVQRCVGRIGIFRGYDISTRYRRLDIRCSGAKTGTTVTISRPNDI